MTPVASSRVLSPSSTVNSPCPPSVSTPTMTPRGSTMTWPSSSLSSESPSPDVTTGTSMRLAFHNAQTCSATAITTELVSGKLKFTLKETANWAMFMLIAIGFCGQIFMLFEMFNLPPSDAGWPVGARTQLMAISTSFRTRLTSHWLTSTLATTP